MKWRVVRRVGKSALPTVVGCLALCRLCFAQVTIHVPADQLTIQGAINSAASGDTILVAPGTYLETLNFNGKPVSLESEQGAEVTIIDGHHVGSVLQFDHGETSLSRVSGFTLRNGQNGFGSAVYALGASPTIVDNIIEANIGGAIWGNGSSMILQRNLIRNQSNCNSWGVVAFVNGSSPSVKDNAFAHNQCLTLNITVPTGNAPEVSNNTFVENTAGLFVDARISTSSHVYRNNIFLRNETGVEVGYANGQVANYPTLVDTVSFGNTTNYIGFPDPTGSNGNIAVDPRLGGVTADDFHPDDGSPAIDAGTNAAVGPGETDFHRGARILNGVVDIGAAECIGSPPSVTLQSDKASIALGESFTLTWTSSGADDCRAKGSWTGARALNGAEDLTPVVSGDLTYKMICNNPAAARAGVVVVQVFPPPAISISVAQSTISEGGTTFLTWDAAPATSCTASGAWTGTEPTTGVMVVGPPTPGTYTYTLMCVGPGGSASASAQLVVLPKPVISFSLDHPDVGPGDTSTLSWSVTNATTCQGANGWSGMKALSGTQTVGPFPIGQYSYSLYCSGTGGNAQQSATLTVHGPPTLDISLAPASVQLGGTSTLDWTSMDATTCAASGAWGGSLAVSGSATVSHSAPGTFTYTVTCQGPGGSIMRSAILIVYRPPTAMITVNPSTLVVGNSANLSWSSADATTCTASGAWSNSIGLTGTQSIAPGTAGTYNYQITCTGLGGAATSTTTLTVSAQSAVDPPGGKGGGGATDIKFLLGLCLLLLSRYSLVFGRLPTASPMR